MDYSVTDFNVVVAVLSVFILLCKIIMTVCRIFHPLLSLFVHSGLVAIWAVSIHSQAGSDMSDPAHPQPGAPWYITKSCGPPVKSSLIGYCKQAKAAFAVTILMTYVSLRCSQYSTVSNNLQRAFHDVSHPHALRTLSFKGFSR